MTGGAFTHNAREFLDSLANPRLEKPFTAQELIGVLARVCSLTAP
jgi:hypothetical protein